MKIAKAKTSGVLVLWLCIEDIFSEWLKEKAKRSHWQTTLICIITPFQRPTALIIYIKYIFHSESRHWIICQPQNSHYKCRYILWICAQWSHTDVYSMPGSLHGVWRVSSCGTLIPFFPLSQCPMQYENQLKCVAFSPSGQSPLPSWKFHHTTIRVDNLH